MERWIRYLSEQELQLIREFIEVDFKINHYQKKSGESYFVAKKKLNLIRQKSPHHKIRLSLKSI
ncbi:Uncharacterised protein [Weissella viridescens]|uniref:Uncharacterized protein n=1 Tax=Weissella viridescens TaxID=1629 RepID=A0A380P8S1_WEIVI|nr:Uncharacterised protein [Weissella viridescens]